MELEVAREEKEEKEAVKVNEPRLDHHYLGVPPLMRHVHYPGAVQPMLSHGF